MKKRGVYYLVLDDAGSTLIDTRRGLKADTPELRTFFSKLHADGNAFGSFTDTDLGTFLIAGKRDSQLESIYASLYPNA